MISISKINEVYIKIDAPRGICQELSERFTFDVPNAKFSPKYKQKIWDGKIRLFSLSTNLIYFGLLNNVIEFFNDNNYPYELDFKINTKELENQEEFIKSINLAKEYTVRDYQWNALLHAIDNNRATFISPTSSGKSLTIYLIARFFNKKTLIIVPTTNLVIQLAKDFIEYGFDKNKIHQIYDGNSKHSDKDITISTWQSIYKEDEDYFNQYNLVVGDEVHNFKANSLIEIMKKLVNCKYRFGLTGTLDDISSNELTISGLFGPIYNVISTKTLMDNKIISDLKIKCVVLNYPKDIKAKVSKLDYVSEQKFLIQCKPRNKFITNLVNSLDGNTLVLYKFVDAHGKILYDMIKEKNKEREVFFVSGKVKIDEREKIRNDIEDISNGVIVASYNTFSTGINIKNLKYIIFASPTKSKIRNLQSIGRGLRKHKDKDYATLYDISDNLSFYGKNNISLDHFLVRIELYNREKFNYKIYNHNLK